MSTTTDRLTKLRNLASHPATPPAEAAAARARIADIEARNPQARERTEKKSGEPKESDYDSWDDYKRAVLDWILRQGGNTSRPDPFAGWADMPIPPGDSHGFNQTYGQTAAEQAYRRGVRAMKITNATYSKVSQELHECGLDVSPGEWEVIIRQLLQSR